VKTPPDITNLCHELDQYGATEIRALSIGSISGYADNLIVATASNRTLIQSIASRIEDYCKSQKLGWLATEGLDAPEWILIDLGDTIIHLFLPEARGYYDIEKLWLDADEYAVVLGPSTSIRE
jgi:ribosome-associated protein